MVTETATYNTKAYLETRNYTLCSDAMAYYNVTESDEIIEYLSDDSEWLAEYQRVCELDLSSPLPTVPFNTSIPAMTITSTEGGFAPVITPSRTSTGLQLPPRHQAYPLMLVSVDRRITIGVCSGSQFGDCCSNYG